MTFQRDLRAVKNRGCVVGDTSTNPLMRKLKAIMEVLPVIRVRS